MVSDNAMHDMTPALITQRLRAKGLLFLMVLGLAGCPVNARAAEVVKQVARTDEAQFARAFPHDPAAFTQGLFFHNGFLYESTGGPTSSSRESSSMRKVDLSTGRVLRRFDLPAAFFGEGAAILNNKVYQLTWRNRTGFMYDPERLTRIGTFSYAGEGWGLTSDGEALILSDGTEVLRFLDEGSLQLKRTLVVHDGPHPVRYLNELEWIRGEIWANVWNRDKIARIEPQTGQVLGWLDLANFVPPVRHQDPAAVANGIAYDPGTGRVFVTGKLWPELYEIRLPR